MRVVPMHTNTTAPGLGNAMEPRVNTVGLQFNLQGAGAVSGTVQVVGRIAPTGPTEDIGSPVSISGTASANNPVVSTVTLTELSAAQIWANLTAVSAISFQCFGSESDL
jgi:hypothetical protein